uniref:Ig-like domain-containing protein n=1 Tax=Macrostomum lignano TaxID=282301 RepID=A0A1I8GP43_9PLAT
VTRRPTEVKFTFRASKEHHGKVLACKFVQDERLIEWRRDKLSVFYKADFDSEVRIINRKVRWNTTVQFSISYSDVGNPSAKHFCRIGSRPLTDPEVRKY